ncbi:glycosyltransferase family 2 protein [Aminipila sp.]|uniref:glycosyltransferase family 2 protein n=1 Tax=Aminipila sp. TaxID=2060095 RepID=UPI00289D53C1|nr:glycosyltransferase family 2 protein [Aminipila sp.]
MLGIVILNYNTAKLTADCINSIMNTYKGAFKIYIVDGGSTDDSVIILEDAYRESEIIKIIQLNKNYGFSYGNNRGAEIAIKEGCRKILITNSDIIFYENAIENLILTFEKYESTALVFPCVYNTGDILQSVDIVIKKRSWLDILIYENIFSKFVPKAIKKRTRRPVEECMEETQSFYFEGCCFLVDSIKFCEVDMLDENIFLYGEESILSEKIIRKNYKMYYIPDSKVLHLKGASSEGITRAERSYICLKSKLYFWYKYKKFPKILDWITVKAGLLILRVRYRKIEGITQLHYRYKIELLSYMEELHKQKRILI